jgi:hypothetical protein
MQIPSWKNNSFCEVIRNAKRIANQNLSFSALIASVYLKTSYDRKQKHKNIDA